MRPLLGQERAHRGHVVRAQARGAGQFDLRSRLPIAEEANGCGRVRGPRGSGAGASSHTINRRGRPKYSVEEGGRGGVSDDGVGFDESRHLLPQALLRSQTLR
jgi:hypothetical protein